MSRRMRRDQIFRLFCRTLRDLSTTSLGLLLCHVTYCQQFIDLVCGFNPALEFAYTITVTSLPLLDIQLTIANDRPPVYIHPFQGHIIIYKTALEVVKQLNEGNAAVAFNMNISNVM